MKLRNPKLLPLLILYARDEEAVVGITRFQKLVYIAQERIENLDEYKFQPHSYGPFSVDLYDDIDELVDHDYINLAEEETDGGNDRMRYTLAPKGSQFVERILEESPLWYSTLLEDISDIKQEYNHMPLLKLLKRIYSARPDMAENSELDLVY